MRKIAAAKAILNTEVIRELATLNIAADTTLVEMLVVGIIIDPLWQRTSRKKKTQPKNHPG